MATDGSSPVLDHLDIRNLIALIAQLADDGDLDDYVRCFTKDARWDMPGAPREGRDDIRAGGDQRRAQGTAGPGSASRHVVNTTAVDVDGDSARATSYWQFYADTATAPRLQSMGRYDDQFVRTAEGWQLAHRRITLG